MKHVMYDLETVGIRTDASIIAIGAVEFDLPDAYPLLACPPETFIGRKFYTKVDLQSSFDLGLTMSASTFYWWLAQSDEARKAIIPTAAEPALAIGPALIAFFDFFKKCEATEVWAHGPHFDVTLVNAAAQKLGLENEVPWRYNAVTDSRTQMKLLDYWPKVVAGTAHNALDDATKQALAAIQCHRYLRKLEDHYVQYGRGHEAPDDLKV